ncbi:MAG: YfcC family protein, partial [Ignavibacteriae bacterium]|nr:YfcC family protein [Ignavibacteriota bacterium]
MSKVKKKYKFKVPNTYLLIFSILVLIAGLTWIIPGGQYERVIVNGREVVVQNSFKYINSNPQGVFALFISPLKGFVEAATIIGCVLIVGGAFNVLAKTDAINSLINKLAKSHKTSPTLRKIFIPVLILMFSIGGATFGMNEEIIPFVLIIVPICLALGYDSIIGVAIPLVGAHVGFASAFLNPFNVGIAQGIAEVPLFSGIGYRMISWAISTIVAIAFLIYYANKVLAK